MPPELVSVSHHIVEQLKREYVAARQQQASEGIVSSTVDVRMDCYHRIPVFLPRTLNIPSGYSYPDLIWSLVCP